MDLGLIPLAQAPQGRRTLVGNQRRGLVAAGFNLATALLCLFTGPRAGEARAAKREANSEPRKRRQVCSLQAGSAASSSRQAAFAPLVVGPEDAAVPQPRGLFRWNLQECTEQKWPVAKRSAMGRMRGAVGELSCYITVCLQNVD